MHTRTGTPHAHMSGTRMHMQQAHTHTHTGPRTDMRAPHHTVTQTDMRTPHHSDTALQPHTITSDSGLPAVVPSCGPQPPRPSPRAAAPPPPPSTQEQRAVRRCCYCRRRPPLPPPCAAAAAAPACVMQRSAPPLEGAAHHPPGVRPGPGCRCCCWGYPWRGPWAGRHKVGQCRVKASAITSLLVYPNQAQLPRQGRAGQGGRGK